MMVTMEIEKEERKGTCILAFKYFICTHAVE